MRLFKRGQAEVIIAGQRVRCAVRPLSGCLSGQPYGEYVQDTLRLLLPYDCPIHPGEKILADDTPYVCVSIRCFPGHVQADVRRCSR